MKGREESDGRVLPEDRRKAVPTAATRGGKATTASEQAGQLELFRATADSPRGADGGVDTGRPVPAPRAAPKARNTKGPALPAMTMEEVASEDNLMRAFERVAQNDGAPGPDRQSVDEVRAHLDVVLPALRRELLEGSYRPGLIRRAWIPKAGGGQRGLGIPNVIDRLVQQAVHLVLSPHYEPTFHESSHGFRPERSCHTAIAEAVRHLEEGHVWMVDLDLESFFDRVHHDRLLARLELRVKDRRRLKVNATKSAVARPEERHFVGFSLRREPEDGRVDVRLSKRSKTRIDEKVRELVPRNWGRSLRDCILQLNAYLLGWIGFFWICTEAAARMLSNLDAHIRRRLRALLLKQWKRKRTIARRLIRLGVKPRTAWKVYEGHRSWWALSHSSPVDRGLRNAYFAERGLVSLAAKWRELQGRAIIAPVQLSLPLG
ncbi:reverse transcriptase domain-containing protein [Sorangium sp. So ce1097]|uniref:reverse transcriptase domain-containing protein n=1 Tax=Sorangium sp. So ce1097 TaxID=3133330 RepID=UPI003F6249E7